MNCNHWLFEDCDYMCPNYHGKDFGFFLHWHMYGDLMDSIPLTNKQVRDLVDKFWDYIDEDTQQNWINFIKNERSGRTKYGKKELENNKL